MAVVRVHPTRINLIRTKRTLEMAKAGLDVLERKRDVLMRELRHFIYDAKKLREELVRAIVEAFEDLRRANVMIGAETVENVALASSVKADFAIDFRSIMGVHIPIVKFKKEDAKPDYGFANTSVWLDKAFRDFYNVLDLIARLAEIEGAVYQIANDVKRTQKRVNALRHIFIPMYTEIVKLIERVLEEREREEFVRMKMAKKVIEKRKYRK
ncbi:V-type ATP synthase subunit D [Candidatus Bathyarchaeota archaeon]|nr:V-type ATP synthase subunit D [Candidatus Bathyarchaeota archaeon]